MLTLFLGCDWVANQENMLGLIADDVKNRKSNRIVLVPESISHQWERNLCVDAGDTVSLYAEVLSFTRMLRSVTDYVEYGMEPCLDQGGRIVAMASAARQLHSKLKAYASVETRPEFLCSLVDSLNEFKQSCISASDLMEASQESQGTLAQKLEELSLLFDTYEGLCNHGKRDPADQMNWLLDALRNCKFAEDHVFYVDGFPDFTQQHQEIISHIITHSPQVYVNLTCDRPNSKNPAFETAGNTAACLLKIAKDAGIPVEIRTIEDTNGALQAVSQRIFKSSSSTGESYDEVLTLRRANNTYMECVAVAKDIQKLICDGYRYKDIRVVCANPERYRNTIQLVFQRFSIPAYISGNESVLSIPIVNALLCGIDAALGGFERGDVLSYMKSAISPIDNSECDIIENYAIGWNICGAAWKSEWTMHPDGLGKKWKEQHNTALDAINANKTRALAPLFTLQQEFAAAKNLSQQVVAVYHFLEAVGLSETLQVLADDLEKKNDHQGAQLYRQLWEILLGALEQMHDVLGASVWDDDTFVRLLKLLLSQYDVGTIPPVLDAVSVGTVNALRNQQAQFLFILGAEEGFMPSYPVATGVLSEQERNDLRALGVHLQGGAEAGLQTQFAAIYDVFCGTRRHITVSVGGGQPSFVYRRLISMVHGEEYVNVSVYEGNINDICAKLVRNSDKLTAESLKIDQLYERLESSAAYEIGRIDPESINNLYGDTLQLSASKVDKQAKCRFSYFLHYGMQAKERKVYEVDPAEFGTFVHDVLENTGRIVMESGGFTNVTLNEILEISAKCAAEYIEKAFGQIDSKRQNYLLNRNKNELFAIVEELWTELQNSQFQPVGFEVSFGEGKMLEPITISGSNMNGKLTGFVDRVDTWEQGSCKYFRVVDYKTGKKSLDYCDILNGVGLQMYLYLFALQEMGAAVVGENPIPAGVQYFPARVPVITFPSMPAEDLSDKKRNEVWRRNGMLLNDEDVVFAMQKDHLSKIGVKVNKEGDLVGNLASRDQFMKLKMYINEILSQFVDDISSGNVKANPYYRGNEDNACKYCPFGDVCHERELVERRVFAATDQKLFWEKIEKGVEKNGR